MIDLNAQVWHIENMENGSWEHNVECSIVEIINKRFAMGYFQIWADDCTSHFLRIQYGQLTLNAVGRGVPL